MATTPSLCNSPSSLPQPIPSDHRAHLLSLLDARTPLSHIKQIHARALRASPHHAADDPQTLFLFSRILYFSSFYDLPYCSRIFSQIPTPNSFSWNTLIRAHANSPAHKGGAFTAYREMVRHGRAPPDNHTFPFLLKACAYLFAEGFGKQVHGHLLALGFGADVYINNSLIHFYSSCGKMECARKVFDKMPERSCVSWNALIDGLVRSGEFEGALRMFVEMQEWFEADGYTMQSVVSACAGLGALSLGMWAHAYYLRRCGFDVKTDILVDSSIVEMYCKCGMLRLGQQVFDRMPKRDVNAWNSMILGFAGHGEAEMALDYFDRMVEEGLLPNSVTFVGLLSACNHRGMVEQGRAYFDMMVKSYEIEPQLEHYGCLVDLLARAGCIDEALDMLSEMPMKPDLVIWRILLDACVNKNGGAELNEEVVKRILESEGATTSSGVYVLLSKLYASAARWDEVGLVRKLMTERGVTKEPGCSSIEINGTNHEFFAGDTCHPETELIYQALDTIEERLEAEGYVPETSQAALVDEEERIKRRALRLHSERLAIAYGLLHRKPGVPIRVFKNLRVCKDCHQVTKLISKAFDVEIIVRDRARFHHFRGGSCSCLDYW